MDKVFDVLIGFNINNVGTLIVISSILISVATSYIQVFNASKIETILMGKNDEKKRFTFAYFILFFVFGMINYLFTLNANFVFANSMILLLTFFVSVILHILKNRGKALYLHSMFKEIKYLIVIITFTAIATFIISISFDINIVSCSIIATLVEVIILAMCFFNVTTTSTSFFVKLENKKWYVFKRINGDFLLCGNENNIEDATQIRLLALEYVTEQKLCFEKIIVNNESKDIEN